MLVFGEDINDGRSIKALVEALRPGAPAPSVRRNPPVYMKGAEPSTIRRNASQIAKVVVAEAVKGPVRAVFVHQDCDAVEPAHLALAKTIEDALAAEGIEGCCAVTPAWETEAWWFLWPDAVAAVKAKWEKPDAYLGKDVGRVRDAKEKLKAAVRPAGLKKKERASFPDYVESDSPKIAEQVKAMGLIDQPGAKSASFDVFRKRVEELL